MFFSNEILTKKGGQFAVVWLVGNFNSVHGSKRLGLKKSDYVSVDVIKACQDMLNPRTQFALRLSSTLLMGIIRIYQKQITIVYDEVKSMWIFLKKGSFMRPENVELQISRSETFALPNPLYHYDKEMGNEQSELRFYTSLGEKALFEGPKATHESRADSAYFTISFGDQELTNTEYEKSLMEIAEESPAKRRKISKDSFLDIIEDVDSPLKIKERSNNFPIEVPGEMEFEADPAATRLLNLTDEMLNEKFAETCSQLGVSDSGLLGDFQDPSLSNLESINEASISNIDENPLLGLPVLPEETAADSVMLDITDKQPLLDETDKQPLLDETENQPLILDESNRLLDEEVTSKKRKSGEEEDELNDKENIDPNIPVPDVVDNTMQELLLQEIATRVDNDPVLQEMQSAVTEDMPADVTLPANVTSSHVTSRDKENPEKENPDKEGDEDKENRDPNAVRRSQRAKKPLRLAQEKAFDTSLGSFTLPETTAPPAKGKRKKKRQLIIDTKTQMTVKEMKKFMKHSRQHLCENPTLVHAIRPTPEQLFSEAHRKYYKKVPELMGLFKRCAQSGDHDLTELLERQEQLDTEENKEPEEVSRKRPRSSVLSEREEGRLGDDTLEYGRNSTRDSTTGFDESSRLSENFGNLGGFRTSTVLKPIRGSGSGVGPMLSPIQQMQDLDQSEIALSVIQELSTVEQPEISALISDDTALESTMFGQPTTVATEPILSPIRDQQEDQLQLQDQLQDQEATMMDETAIRPTNIIEEVPLPQEAEPTIPQEAEPTVPLTERLSGIPHDNTTVVQPEETMSAFKYFPHRENRKFYRFLERKFSPEKREVDFEELVPLSHTRKTAALAFYQILLLKKYNHIDVSQEDGVEFGKISIKLKS